jgi:hypothetical protein
MELTVYEAARRVGVTEEAVRNLLRKGVLRGRQIHVGHRLVWRVDSEAVAVWQVRRAEQLHAFTSRSQVHVQAQEPRHPASVRQMVLDVEPPLPTRPVPPAAAVVDDTAELAHLRRENDHLWAALMTLLGR